MGGNDDNTNQGNSENVSPRNVESTTDSISSSDSEEGIILVIAATKSDLGEKRQISKNRAEDYANSINAILFETSSKENRGVSELFERISEEVLVVKKKEIEMRNAAFSRQSVMLTHENKDG